MAGLVPAIHVFLDEKVCKKDVDARDDGVPAASRGGVSSRGHDAGEVVRFHRNAAAAGSCRSVRCSQGWLPALAGRPRVSAKAQQTITLTNQRRQYMKLDRLGAQ